mmetsp:Transcript_62503/g.148131  ORF Transcript_62503/g.148131 Transcript_62503/m.148131 type:complete len:207 (+) Transcript_62503:2976-3596(+)
MPDTVPPEESFRHRTGRPPHNPPHAPHRRHRGRPHHQRAAQRLDPRRPPGAGRRPVVRPRLGGSRALARALRPRRAGHRAGPRAQCRRGADQRDQQARPGHAGAGGVGHAGGHLPQHHEGAGRLGLPAEDDLRRGRIRRNLPRHPAHRQAARAGGQGNAQAGRRQPAAGPAEAALRDVARPAHQPAAHRAAHPRHAVRPRRRGGEL